MIICNRGIWDSSSQNCLIRPSNESTGTTRIWPASWLMICAAEHKSAAPLTPTDAATSLWHLQNTKIHMELFASPIEHRINTRNFFYINTLLVYCTVTWIIQNTSILVGFYVTSKHFFMVSLFWKLSPSFNYLVKMYNLGINKKRFEHVLYYLEWAVCFSLRMRECRDKQCWFYTACIAISPG